MSDAHHAAQGGKDHVPHVQPLKVYLRAAAALFILTGVTVGASYINFGAANLWIAILIATTKALTVALVFMHLAHDDKFHSIIFGMSIVFLGIFVGFTMFDTEARGRADSIEKEQPADIKQPFAGTRAEAELKAKAQAREHEGGHEPLKEH
jgi:cytochrome c oxidase subunit 4